MAIDYSKWDKLELSDDSDIEVHPNVDKNSFIKWKQRDIHEKREQRNHDIKSILIQLTMYAKLNERVDYILTNFTISEIENKSFILSKLNKKFDKDEKFNYHELIKEKGDTLRKGLKDLSFTKDEIENTPPYNEMIDDLLIQIQEDHPDCQNDGSKLIDYLKDHRAKIDDILSKQTITLDDLLYQKSMLISSDDYHTGFDRSFLNKDKDEPQPKLTKSKEKVTSIETLNPGSETSPAATSSTVSSTTSSSDTQYKEKTDAEMLDELEILPETEEFSKIPLNDYLKISEYLMKHSWICTEQQKDALIMTAFDSQFEGNNKQTKQIIHQSLLLQYIGQLSGGPKGNKESRLKAIKLFITRISEPGPAKQGFEQDVNNTFNHIVERCKIIQKEQEEQKLSGNGDEEIDGEQIIQLRSLDDNAPLSVTMPLSNTPEYKIFENSLPKDLQDAIKTEKIDEVNKVFATYKMEDAEKYLEIINQCGVIGIESVLEDEEEYNMLKQQYENQENLQKELDELEVVDEVNHNDKNKNNDDNNNSVVHNTVDEVD